jgi:arginine metabolism regulation protein II
MSGDTSSCHVHLNGAGQLIRHMGTLKKTYSPKAIALHRIYYYLRLIYESTAVNNPSFCARYPTSKEGGDLACRNSLNITEDDNNSGLPSYSAESTHLTTYEYVYGIPRELLTLLRSCIETVDLVDQFRAKNGHKDFPENLDRKCEDVERDILDWSCEDHIRRLDLVDGSTNARIILHQTRAFYHAVIVYFTQNVRLLNHRYLRQYIEAILGSIEEIEQIKADTRTLAAPLYWPAFIGASEAFEERLQERFRYWYDRVEMYGIEAVRTGIRVLEEVWQTSPVPKRITSSWRIVLNKTGDVLMLT